MAKPTDKRRGTGRAHRHDAAFKHLYAFGLMAWDLMEVVLPKALFDELDPSTLERLPAEWFSASLDRRVGDCVWRVRRRGGRSLVQPIEFQRRPERLMPLRLATYTALLQEDLARQGQLDPGGRLPLVRPVVLYNGVRPWRAPTSLAADGEAAWPAFALVDMGRARVEDLPVNNAVAAQIEMHQGALAQNSDGVLGRLSERLGGREHRALRAAFVEWVRVSVVPGMVPEVSRLKGELRKIAELGELQDMKSLVLKSMEDYWQGQVAEARADERALLCRQAGRKFGERAAERLSAVIDGVTDPERLAEVGDGVIDCGTEAEFLARLQPRG
ncbi:MAG: Rpn family recombination-promoting nuclease/putative transposase [Gammaproteobacteria bacterium]|nr:Rpn family recombination-promoting nuclease/putative transposase [Gammaproteobacteria bacterium]